MRKIIIIISFLVLILASCSSDNKFDIDVSDVHLDLTVQRLDQDIFKSDSVNVIALQQKYGQFLDLYSQQILRIGRVDDPNFLLGLQQFKNYLTDNKVNEEVNRKFESFEPFAKEIETAFKHVHYYMPDQEIPKIVTIYSGFNQSVVSDSAVIAISLEKYLGAEYKPYEKMGVDNYLRKKMTPEYISIDVMRAWTMMQFPFDNSVDNLLSYMVYLGKIQYLLDTFLPQKEAYLKHGYTQKQMAWATRNEKNIWDYMVESKLLFSTDYMEIKKFTGESPFTAPFGNISCPKAGVWVGTGIVYAYMNNHPDVSLQDLMNEHDFQKILSLSGYKP